MILGAVVKLAIAVVLGGISRASYGSEEVGGVSFIALVLALLFGVAGLIPLLRWLFS